MKKVYIITFSIILFCGTASFAQATSTSPISASVPQNVAVLKWKTTAIDMGKIPQGVPATATFEVTNTGAVPVVLKEVKPGCGCTTAGYTKEPIAQGKTGNVKATYNAMAVGKFTKSVAVTADNNEKVNLMIYGEVLPPAVTTPSQQPSNK